MPNEGIDLKEYGMLVGQVERLTNDIEALQIQLAATNSKLDSIMQTLNQAQGGWKTLMWVGGAAASVATGVNWALEHLSFK